MLAGYTNLAECRQRPYADERLLQRGAVQPESSPDTTSFPYPVIGNRKSHIYHRPDCPNYSQVAPRNRVAFNSAAEAAGAGYRLSGNCR